VESPNRVQRRMGTSHSCMYSLRAIPALQKPLHKSCVGCICPRYASRALNALYAILTASLGFSGNIATLDSVIGKVPVGGPVISITASFEGTQYLPLSFWHSFLMPFARPAWRQRRPLCRLVDSCGLLRNERSPLCCLWLWKFRLEPNFLTDS
jgi:hypothetical protein